MIEDKQNIQTEKFSKLLELLENMEKHNNVNRVGELALMEAKKLYNITHSFKFTMVAFAIGGAGIAFVDCAFALQNINHSASPILVI